MDLAGEGQADNKHATQGEEIVKEFGSRLTWSRGGLKGAGWIVTGRVPALPLVGDSLLTSSLPFSQMGHNSALLPESIVRPTGHRQGMPHQQ